LGDATGDALTYFRNKGPHMYASTSGHAMVVAIRFLLLGGRSAGRPQVNMKPI
jgi:hypothetical protein